MSGLISEVGRPADPAPAAASESTPARGTLAAGCVSLPQSELVAVLRWLSPADNPLIRITGVASAG
jgi:hypothetical protein